MNSMFFYELNGFWLRYGLVSEGLKEGQEEEGCQEEQAVMSGSCRRDDPQPLDGTTF